MHIVGTAINTFEHVGAADPSNVLPIILILYQNENNVV